jgi:hypothetical protein
MFLSPCRITDTQEYKIFCRGLGVKNIRLWVLKNHQKREWGVVNRE